MKKILLFGLFTTFLILTVDATPTRSYDNCAIISEGQSIKLYWTVTGSSIQLAMEGGSPNGYFSIGFSNDGSMDSGNFADAWATSYTTSGRCLNGCILDLWMPDTSQPNVDTVQSLLNKTVTKTSTLLIAEFERLLNTNDNNDWIIRTDQPMGVIWAMNVVSKIGNTDIPGHDPYLGVNMWGSTVVHFGQPSSCTSSGTSGVFSAAGGAFKATYQVTPDLQFIDFTVDGQTNGYVTLGISNSPLMSNCDAYTGWVVDATSQLVLYDTWSPDYNIPVLDATSCILNPTGSQSGGRTTFSFRRKLITGDANDIDITDKSMYIVYALGTTDGTSASSYPKHYLAGAGKVNFFSSNNTNNSTGVTPPIVTDGGVDPTTGAVWTSPAGNFKVYWVIDGDYINFKMDGKTAGYISMGISDKPLMSDCDAYTGWINDDGTFAFFDTYSPDYLIPRQDTDIGGTNDLIVTAVKQDVDWTSISFRRKLVTGDKNDKDIINDYQYLLFAIAPADGTDAFYPKHTETGYVRINFFEGSTAQDLIQITPGLLLMILVSCTFVLYVVIRYSYRFQKRFRATKSDDGNSSSKAIDSSKVESPSTVSAVNHENVMPVGRNYYRGSQKMAVPFDPKDYVDEYGEQNTAPEYVDQTLASSSALEMTDTNDKNKPSLVAKDSNNVIKNFMHGIIHRRIPGTGIPIVGVLFAFLYVGVNIGCLFVEPNFAKGFGSLVSANMLLVTLPATRNSVLVYFMGLPFDRTIMYHRWLGRFTIILTSIHVFWIWANWIMTDLDFYEQTITTTNLFGLFGWITSLAILATSIDWIRRQKFEVFFYSHFLFLAYFVLASFHSEKFIPYAIVSVIFYAFDRLIRVIWGIIPRKTVSLTIKDPKETVVQLRFSKHFLARKLGMYKVGQYVFINFPTVSLLEWHPFSVSSGPDERTAEVNIKALGNHTRFLVAKAKSKESLWIRVDGPYGNLNINHRRFPILALIGGGIGFTPILGILKDLFRTGDLDPKKKDPKHCVEQVFAIWAIQSRDQYDWFASELIEIWNAAAKPGMPTLNLKIYISRGEDDLDPSFFKGRPDFPEFFNGIVRDFPNSATTVFVCGPKAMVENVWDISMSKSRKGNRFHFHNETFEF